LTNWRLDRLSAIDRNVLRLAAAEMLFFDDVPPLVSIQEAVQLAEKYGTGESPRFVNGVLDALMRHQTARTSGGGTS
ncbi:MAG: transcription antitermination factor NusB, partial [Gammaproteobacteria bacterium]|nr:transcription antitermination factor NusB [Gemmatimonadota bacterium]NIU73331.1 transcription antitermination factor NusB [Gammaproteobacteria bacterium]